MVNATTATPPSTNSSNGASPEDSQFRVVRKRNRVPLSCSSCRHRKLKCNRGHPCDNCTKRGDMASCTYAAPTSRKKGPAIIGHNGGAPDDMQNRIDRLENLVLSLMTNGSQSSGGAAAAQAAISSVRSESIATSGSRSLDADGEETMREAIGDDSDVNEIAQGVGIMKVDGSKTMFVSDSHWYTILADIAEVKHYFASHRDQFMEHVHKVQAAKGSDQTSASHLFCAPRLSDKSELLATMPSKPAADRLIARYFNSYDPAVHIIHGPTFQKYYDRHWQFPHDTPTAFLAMLYGIMALSLQSYNRAGDEPPEYRGKTADLSVSFRRLTAQAIILADIKEPIPQLLDALLLHLQAEYGRSRDSESGVHMLVGLIVRIAMRMGYHRDPGPYPNVTPFHAEMRRRAWTFVMQADLFFSFQFGMPSIARSDFIDTKLPRNLYDDELFEDMSELPPSRPESEPTPMSYMIAKGRITAVFSKVVERVSSLANPPAYEEIMDLDAALRDARSMVPSHLRMRPLHESMHDTSNLIMQRFGLELLYLKSQCVLHRKFIARGRESQRYAYSRRTCIDASMDMLAHQATLHHESQTGGRLRNVKWYISSLTTHDFLLAAMIVCLDLYHCAEAERTGRKASASPLNMELWAQERREQMTNALKHSLGIWESLSDQSVEAYKASQTLHVMLEKLMAHQSSPASSSSSSSAMQNSRGGRYATHDMNETRPYGIMGNGNVSIAEHVAPEHSAAMTLGLLSAGGLGQNTNFGQTSTPTNGSGGGSTSMSTPDASMGMVGNESGRLYPASMAGLLNDPLPKPQRSGLTPGATGPETSGIGGVGSPFSQMFGQYGMGMEINAADLDWGAWDSYVQGATMEPVSMWPNPMDFANLDPSIMSQQQQGQQQQQPSSSVPTTGLFMGASTPATGNAT